LSERKLWLDRTLSLVTALVFVVAAYLLISERLLPALRGEPALVGEGERLDDAIEFHPLAEDRLADVLTERISVPSDRPTLLLVFASTCPACYANLEAWSTAIDAADGVATVLAVGFERDRKAAREYALRHLPRAMPVAPRDPRWFAGRLGVSIVPFTALVNADGTVGFVRQGRLDAASVASLRGALGALVSSSTP